MDDDPNCPKCGYGQPWCVEVRGVYDGGLYWECPSCQHMWPRFPEGKLHRIALEMIKERKAFKEKEAKK